MDATGLKIPQTVMFEVVSLCLVGFSRSEIAKMYLEKKPRPDWLDPIRYHRDADQVQILAQRFRQADIRDTKFAYTKYQQHAQQCHEAYMRQLDKYFDNLIIELIAEEIDNDPEIAKAMQHLRLKMQVAIKEGIRKINSMIPESELQGEQQDAD